MSGQWHVGSTTAQTRDFDGVLVPVGPFSDDLARALTVQYGSVDAASGRISWHPAGTLAEPRTYAEALGHSPTVDTEHPVTLPVRVSLPEPDSVAGVPGEVLAVSASFVVSYLGDEPEGGEPGGGAGGPRPVPPDLATTGWGSWWLIAAAAAAIAVGADTTRRARRDEEG